MTGLLGAGVVEALLVLVMAAIGWLLATDDHGPVWRTALALPLGAAVVVAVELVLLATGLPIAFPRVALLVAVVAAVGIATARRGAVLPAARGVRGARGVRPVVVAVAVGAVVGTVTLVVPLANVTADSFRYLTVAHLLATEGSTVGMSDFLLQTRGLVVGALHGLAPISPGYLRPLTPLLAVSGVVLLWLLVREGTQRLDPRTTRWLAVGAAALLATNHRFVFNALYLNGHLVFAVWLLVLVGALWRITRDPSRADAGAAVVVVLVAAALTVVRPEATLVAGTALAPVVLDRRVAVWWRRVVLGAFGVAVVAWHLGVVVATAVRIGEQVLPSLWAMVALGALLVLGAALLPLADRVLTRPPLVTLHVLAWLALGVLAVRDPFVLRSSAVATLRNVVRDGRWGVSLLLLATLLVLALWHRRVDGERALLFPLATFVPLSLVLAYLRGGPYRIGPGDSLNRMLLHVLPLAVLALALTADGEPRVWRRSRPAADAVPD